MASAPLTGAHVNVSPKGMPSSTFTVFDATHCAYVDATGSGSETIAHIYENGRVTLCWCSFDSAPRIMRWYCRGGVVEHDSPEFGAVLARMGHGRVEGARAVITLEVWKVGTSCGMSVPLLEAPQGADEELGNDSSLPMATTAGRHFRQRDSLRRWAGVMESKGKMLGYREQKNSTSLDGLPAIRAARKGRARPAWIQGVKGAILRVMSETRGMCLGVIMGILMMLFCGATGVRS